MPDFGERVDLTANLASILRRYPFSIGVFREIIQNSDDAKATRQVFILDRRTHGTTTLLHPSLVHLQGPALLACNDGVFSKEDWEAVRNVSQSSKVADTEKIGKHGLGSRAYYHLTDNPQYLSGGCLAIFDPHRWAFEHGGWIEKVEDLASRHPDQLKPFYDHTTGAVYSGTVVRLALRTASHESRISSAKPSPDKIHDLLVDFIQKELHLMLLFLSHLTSIEVREIDASGQVWTLAAATAYSKPQELSQLRDPNATFSLAHRQVTVHYHASLQPSSSPSAGVWFILRASFDMDDCVHHLSPIIGDSLDNVRKELVREKLRPEVALAFQGALAQRRGGRLFTYLPLPLETGFPCHIHGVFSLTDARQNLRNPSETIMPGTADALAVEWNKLLFSSIIPRAWLAFLELVASGDWNELQPRSVIRRAWVALSESVASAGLDPDLYPMLPPRQEHKTSGDAMYWTTLLRDIVVLARDRKAEVWPVFGSGADKPMHTALGDALIASVVDKEEQLRTLAKAGVTILRPPPEVYAVLLDIVPAQKLTPRTVRPRLAASPRLSTMPREECNTIVEFLLSDGRLEDLVDVPIIPLVQGGSVALSKRGFKRALFILFNKEDAELFGQFAPRAVALHDLSRAPRSLLGRQGSNTLNVVTLSCAQAAGYIREAASKFPIWPWAQTCAWLSVFWKWIGQCAFREELLKGVGGLPLLPTTEGQLCPPSDFIFSLPPDWDDRHRVSLSRIGIKFLDSSIALDYLQHCRPAILRSISDPKDLLDALRLISMDAIRGDGDATKVLQEHLSSRLRVSIRLTDLQKATLRSLPIHPVLSNHLSADHIQYHPASLPETSKLYCLRTVWSLPLPVLDDATFVHVTDSERRLLEQIDYTAATQPLSEQKLVQLHVDNIASQPPAMRLRILEYLVKNRQLRSADILEKLRRSPIVRINDGRYVTPQDVIDPGSPVTSIIPLGDSDAIFADEGENTRIAAALAALGLLRRELDTNYVYQRIKSFGARDVHPEAARGLLQTLDSTFYDCSGVQGIDDIAWIPTRFGLRTSNETRDASQHMLCDRVWDLLDTPLPIRSPFLRRMLGWHEPIPVHILVEQLHRLLSEPRGDAHPPYLLEITSELGRRYHKLSQSEMETLFDLLHTQEWVPTSDGRLRRPSFAVFDLPYTLWGFGQIFRDLAARSDVREFLIRMGCPTRPTNDSIVMQLETLPRECGQEDIARESIELLRALDFASLTDQEQARLLVPGVDNSMHPIDQLFHNDLGARMPHFHLPQGRVQVHGQLSRSLRGALRIPSLGSLNLEPLELDSEDMREDLTTRVSSVLRAYHKEQAFNEFLANADDAGATKLSIMLDEEPTRQASPDTVLCESMASFCRGPALVVHNDAEFTMDDFLGICRIGRGGKESRNGTIGRFGLGSLSFYHFAEVAMILSGSRLLLLDPSGRFLPQELNKNSYLLPLDNLRRVYPGHLQVFDGLFGFRVGQDHYKGTIIRLPLRTPEQAIRSALSKQPLTSDDIHAMLMRYRPNASRSLFFIQISEVAALRSGRTAPLWSTRAYQGSKPLVEDEPYTVEYINIDDLDEHGNCQTSSWVVVSSKIPPSHYRQWEHVIARNRVKNVSVAVAGELVEASCGYHATQSHFFASLPLPIKTSLPVHVHASFILADDRRNIRWDGDGTLNDDSRFNHWLLTAALSPLYLFAVETWTGDNFPSEVIPWPGITDITSDPVSRAFMDAFYGDPEIGLLGSSRQVLRSVTSERICPSSAVFRGGEPKTIKKILLGLRPAEMVELPRQVRAELFRLSPGQACRVGPLFVSRVLNRKRDVFQSAYQSGAFTVVEIEDCVKYLLEGETADALVGLPLLPLAVPGHLSNVECAHGSPQSPIFAGHWIVCPWPLFSAQHFLHPEFNQKLLMGKEYNVVPFGGSAMVELIQDIIPKDPVLDASSIQASWIFQFWHFWAALIDQDPDCLKDLPLIPTANGKTFLSLDHALALPALRAPTQSLSVVATILQKLDAVIIQDVIPGGLPAGLPSTIRERLIDVAFSFRRVMAFFSRVKRDNDLVWMFSKLSEDERHCLADWIRRSLGEELPAMRRQAGDDDLDFDIARHLPIWTAHRRGTTGPPVLRPLTDPFVRLLPRAITLTDDKVVLFLGKNPHLYFVEHSPEITLLKATQPMSAAEFAAQLDFPPRLPTDRLTTYRTLLVDLLALRQGGVSFQGLKVPNEDQDMVDPSTMYKSSVPEFRAAFEHRRYSFVHPDLRSFEERLVPFGLHQELSRENFITCVRAIHEDSAEHDTAEDRQRYDVVFRWYSSKLPLMAGSDDGWWWRRLDGFSFIPRHSSRRSGGPASFRDSDYAPPFPHLVSPSKILREEYSSVAWTQRALFATAPDIRLYMVDEVVGVPSVDEVVRHLRVLTLRIAPNHRGDPELLADLKATYEFLNGREAEAEPYLRPHRREPLFLNVNDPTKDEWRFCAAGQMMFNVPDEDDRQEVRALLSPFRRLLLAAGAQEIKLPGAPTITLSSSEEELARLRASFDDLRRSKTLTDVTFRVPGGDSGDELWAHRTFLVAASEFFRDSFTGSFLEGGPGFVQRPIVVPVKDVQELQCARLILDHIYTGHFDGRQDRKCLLALLQLAHRWGVSDVQKRTEALLVNTITPATFLELKDYAEEVGATTLLEKVEEFARDNAVVLDEIVDFSSTQVS